MGRAVETCIYEEAATKHRYAGFRVRKWVKDQWRKPRQVTEIFRPVRDTPASRQQALERARAFRDRLEEEKRGKVFLRFSEPLPTRERTFSSYSIPLHEYSNERAQQVVSEINEAAEAEWVVASRKSIGEYVESEFLPRIQKKNSPSDYGQKRSAWKAILTYAKSERPTLPNKTIDQFRPADLDDFVDWMEDQCDDGGAPRYSETTIKRYFSVARSFVKHWAASEGHPNPADTVLLRTDTARIRGRRADRKVMTEPERQALEAGIEAAIEQANTEFNGRYLYTRIILRYLHAVLSGTGMRVGEALALERRHIDFDQRTVRIEHAVSNGEIGWTKRGKRLGSEEKGTRIIPLPDSAVSALAEWLERRTEWGYPPQDDARVIFCNIKGGLLSDQQIRDYYKNGCEHADIDLHVGPHMVRHTFNNDLRLSGLSTEVRQALMGHADADTNKIYTNVEGEEARSAMEAVTQARATWEARKRSNFSTSQTLPSEDT